MSKLQLLRSYQQELIRKQEFWAKVISEWHVKPENPKDFCKKRGIVKGQFYYWRNKLNNNNNVFQTSRDTNFIELKATNQAAGHASTLLTEQTLSLLVTLPNNISITIKVPSLGLSNVIQQLGGLSC